MREEHRYLLIKPLGSFKGNRDFPAFDVSTSREIKVKVPKPAIRIEFAGGSDTSLLSRLEETSGEVVIVLPLADIASQVFSAFADE